ncbi:MAG TPA: heparan-alpha-glucosaminide N-acetyltransferase domain-containing protein [Ignavibacteriaceae bacterium]|nr:heparan-alpha-glucosaminide N-acetyltransferase domain-containing protein [Ignavibacteriaceae bacterium]
MNNSPAKPKRFEFIDQFRGFIVILMLLDHASYYLNSVQKYLDPLDPLFSSWGQFILRYSSYLCAPGFLMMNGAMMWLTYQKGKEKGLSNGNIKWNFIKRGLFLVLLQMTWVNSSWSGFARIDLVHLGIISSIGMSMILLSFIIHFKWPTRLIIAILILVIHPFLLQIKYDPENTWQMILMQTFIDAGEFNKYPVIPWFAVGILGSVMAPGWLRAWKTDKQKILMSLGLALIAFIVAAGIRMGRGYGNIFPFSEFGSYSFFLDQKYPPSLYFNIWFFGCVLVGVALFIALYKYIPKVLDVIGIVGKVPLFFYCMHIALLGIFSKRIDFYYRIGDLTETYIGAAILLTVMLLLSAWFWKVKQRSSNFIIKMI